jgi:hypothetical protein
VTARRKSRKFPINFVLNGEFSPHRLEVYSRNSSSNLLYAKEDRSRGTLKYVCKACQYEEHSEATCTQRTELGSTAGATAGTTTDVAYDATVCNILGGHFTITRV